MLSDRFDEEVAIIKEKPCDNPLLLKLIQLLQNVQVKANKIHAKTIDQSKEINDLHVEVEALRDRLENTSSISQEQEKLCLSLTEELNSYKNLYNDTIAELDTIKSSFVQQPAPTTSMVRDNSISRGHKQYREAKLIFSESQTSHAASTQCSPKRKTAVIIPQTDKIVAQIEQQNKYIEYLQNENKRLLNERDKYYDIAVKKQNTITRDDVMNYFKKSKPDCISDVGWNLIADIFINAHRKPNGRQFSIQSKEVAFILYAKSAKTYNTARSYIPLPTLNTLKSTFAKEELKNESIMLDIKKISPYLDEYVKNYGKERSIINTTLAVDAISINPINLPAYKKSLGSVSCSMDAQIKFTKEALSDEQREVFEKALKNDPTIESDKLAYINSVFIFYLEPHDPTLPCIPVHLYLKNGGSANNVIRKLIDEVIKEIEKNTKIKVSNISSDGDIGHQNMYDKSFQEILELSKDLNIEEIYESGKFFELTHVSAADLLHLFKVLRIRFLLNDINIFPDELDHVARCETIRSIFKDGNEISDLSAIGKMRDSYAIMFFSFENLANLIALGEYDTVIAVLPFVCFLNAVTNSALKIETVIKLLNIAYEFVVKFLNIMSIPREEWVETGQTKRNKKDLLTILPINTLKRIVPTLITLIINLRCYYEINIKNNEDFPPEIKDTFKSMLDIAIERFGTHPEENFNGFLRDESESQNTISTIMRIVARAGMIKNLMIEHGVNVHKRSRANTGGLKVSEFMGVIPDLPECITPKEFVDSVFVLADAVHPKANINLETCNVEMFISFNQWLQTAVPWSKMGKYQKIKVYEHSPASNSTIQSRNIANSI